MTAQHMPETRYQRVACEQHERQEARAARLKSAKARTTDMAKDFDPGENCEFGRPVDALDGTSQAGLKAENDRLRAVNAELVDCLQALADECQLARKYLVLNNDAGMDAYNRTAKAVNYARFVIGKALNAAAKAEQS